jgi:hypothetical protein
VTRADDGSSETDYRRDDRKVSAMSNIRGTTLRHLLEIGMLFDT